MAKRLQPATRNRKCSVCGLEYEYPIKGVKATRFHCEQCADLPATTKKILGRMSKRIVTLEKEIAKLKKAADQA